MTKGFGGAATSTCCPVCTATGGCFACSSCNCAAPTTMSRSISAVAAPPVVWLSHRTEPIYAYSTAELIVGETLASHADLEEDHPRVVPMCLGDCLASGAMAGGSLDAALSAWGSHPSLPLVVRHATRSTTPETMRADRLASAANVWLLCDPLGATTTFDARYLPALDRQGCWHLGLSAPGWPSFARWCRRLCFPMGRSLASSGSLSSRAAGKISPCGCRPRRAALA